MMAPRQENAFGRGFLLLVLVLVAFATLAVIFVGSDEAVDVISPVESSASETMSAISPTTPTAPAAPVADSSLAIVGVRDIPPAGAPAQIPPLPAFKRGFNLACGATAPPANLTPKNLLRWSFDQELGFPHAGFDLYRCCGAVVAPPSADEGWVKLNTGNRIRPPALAAHGQNFVNGSGWMPDQTRQVKGPMFTSDEWKAVCLSLAALGVGALTETSCGGSTSSQAVLQITQDPLQFLMLTSLRPEYATLLGLYWVDGEAPDGNCFYRIQGYWSDAVREAVTGPLRYTPVSPPTGLATTQKPAVGSDDCMQLGGPTVAAEAGQLSIGLTWDMLADTSGMHAGEVPITFNVCRQRPSDTAILQINTHTYEAAGQTLTGERPVVVGKMPQYDSQGQIVMTPSGEPALAYPAVFYRDALGEPAGVSGTYSYQITGIDIFGRESLPSDPTQITLVDAFSPPAPVNLKAETSQPPTQTHADITLSFDWTHAQMVKAPDTTGFRIYRRPHIPDRGHLCACGLVGGECPALCRCPLPLPADPDWEEIHSVAIGAYTHRFDDQNPLPPHPTDPNALSDEEAMFGAVLPVQRYVFVDTPVVLAAGDPPVVHYYYRVLAVDGESPTNVGEPSGPARGHVVDNAPATPPDAVIPLYSRSDWSGMIDVHLLWKGDTSGTDPMGYKLLRSARAPTCKTDDECPKDCDQNAVGDVVCNQTLCQGGFCGGPDTGPTGARQLDREASLTDGVITYNAEPTLREGGKLKALATLNNLFIRDTATGAPIPVTSAYLDSLDPDLTQYGQSSIPAKAASQVFFFRVMAVSRAGMQESEPGQPSSINLNPFVVQIPDFIAPSAPQLLSTLARPQEGAIELRWSVGPERDAHRPPGGYTLLRADLGERPCADIDVVCCQTQATTAPTAADFTWLSPEGCMDLADGTIMALGAGRQVRDGATGAIEVFMTSSQGEDIKISDGLSTGRCEGNASLGCTSSSECGSAGPCLTGQCQGGGAVCRTSADCGASGPCVTGTCRGDALQICQADGDCAGPDIRGKCSGDPTIQCIDATDCDDGDSATVDTCEAQCLVGTCASQRAIGCTDDGDCPGADTCALSGTSVCEAAAAVSTCSNDSSIACTTDTVDDDCGVGHTCEKHSCTDDSDCVLTYMLPTAPGDPQASVSKDRGPCVNRRRAEVVFTPTGLAAYCGIYQSVCCDIPGGTATTMDASQCDALGGSPHKPLVLGNTGQYTPDAADLDPTHVYRFDVYRAESGAATGGPIAAAVMMGDAPQALTWRVGSCRLDNTPCSETSDCAPPPTGYCDPVTSTCEADDSPCSAHADCPLTGTCVIQPNQQAEQLPGACAADGTLSCTTDAECPMPVHQVCKPMSTGVVIEHRAAAFSPLLTAPALPTDTGDPLLPDTNPQLLDGVQVFTDDSGGLRVMRARDAGVLADRDYAYALTLVDSAGNTSALSDPLIGRTVDVIAPLGPQNLAAAEDIQGIMTVTWDHPEGDLKVRVKRSTESSGGPWHVLERLTDPLTLADDAVTGPASRPYTHWPDASGAGWGYRYTDPDAPTGTPLWYRVEVFDDAGNKSPRNDGIAFVGGTP